MPLSLSAHRGRWKTVLLYGGSFDPVHDGHTALSLHVAAALAADAVLYIPTGKQPLKNTHAATPMDRLHMLNIAVREAGEEAAAAAAAGGGRVSRENETPPARASAPGTAPLGARVTSAGPELLVVDWEVLRGDGAPTFSADTVAEIRAQLGDDVTLRWLIGEDNVPTLHRWSRIDDLMSMAEFVVVARPDDGDIKDEKAAGRDDADGRAAEIVERVVQRLPEGFTDVAAWRERVVVPPKLLDISSTDIRQRLRTGASLDGLVHPRVVDYIREHNLYM